MATVIRVKRKICAEPAETLVINCKRSRSEVKTDNDTDNVTASLKFAGRVTDKNEPVSKHVKDAIRKDKIEKEYKLHTVDIISKARKEQRQIAKSNRLKVISRNRGCQLEDLDNKSSVKRSNDGQDKFCVVDVEEEVDTVQSTQKTETIMCNSVPMVREKVIKSVSDLPGYVYDIYYLNDRNFDTNLLENIVEIGAFSEDYVFDGYRNDDLEYCDDDDDSNDEDNWRNDYPDEDPRIYDPFNGPADGYEYIDVSNIPAADEDGDDLANQVGKCKLATGEDLSSDEEEEDEQTPCSFGAYKSRVLQEMYKAEVPSSEDEEYNTYGDG